MYLLRWLSVCLCLVTAAANQLWCDHPQCEMLTSHRRDLKYFNVEDQEVEFHFSKTEDDEICEDFSIDCGDSHVLNSPAMPRFISEFRVSSVNLIKCPLSTQNASIKDTLAALNVTLHPLKDRLELELTQFPADQLTHQTFLGYESLTYLKIKNYTSNAHQESLPEAGFLKGLINLRSLHLINVPLPAGEISRFPQTIDRLWLCQASLNSVPRTVQGIVTEVTNALPGLRHLMLDQYRVTAPEYANTSFTTIQSNSPYVLESLLVLNWRDHRLTPLEHCNALLTLEAKNPKVEELPERWLAACPLLKNVTLIEARSLTELPEKLLDGATALKSFTIRMARISSIPERFLAGAPNLVELNLIFTDLRGPIPSSLFQGTALKSLSFYGNRLRNSDLSALSSLTSLTHLNLDGNDLGNFCIDKGYSSLQNLTSLKVLSLRKTYVTQICQDWRENFIYLEKLSLDNTHIDKLEFTDFIFNRDVTVTNPTVTLSATVEFVNFTRGNYEKALSTPGAGITFNIKRCCSAFRRINCDCSSYWLRRAVIDGHVIKMNNLNCNNGKKFKNVTPNDMCSVPETQV